MKWIKASDQQPNWEQVNAIRRVGSCTVIPSRSIYKVHEDSLEIDESIFLLGQIVPFEDLEWLDETDQEPNQKPIRDKTERLFRAVTALLPEMSTDNPKQMELYHALHNLREYVRGNIKANTGHIDQDAYLADIKRFSKLMSIAAIELLRLDSCDDAELGKLYLQFCKSIKGINDVILSIENPLFTQAKATVPDQSRKRVQDWTDLKDVIHELATALRDLHDAQNGPPLERDREEYAAVMVRVVEVLDKVGY